MPTKVGSRVGAILGAQDRVVRFLGFGVYVGDEVPPNEGGGSLTAMLAEVGCSNPKIVLDSGAVVWGCECWWAPERQIEERLHEWRKEGWEIRNVRMADAREGKV